MREIPFDITKYEDIKFATDFSKFQELYKKYSENLEEILEFAKLYEMFVVSKNNKWR